MKFPRLKNKGFIALPILMLVAALAIATTAYFGTTAKKAAVGGAACTQEAMQCPDGSSVGRTGPNCEFVCPAGEGLAPSEVEGWQTYRNEKYGFEVKYPRNWYATSTENFVTMNNVGFDKPYESPGISMGILTKYGDKSLKEVYNGQNEPALDFEAGCKQIKFAEESAYECFPAESFAANKNIVFKKGGLIFDIQDFYLNDISVQILSTFRFLDN